MDCNCKPYLRIQQDILRHIYEPVLFHAHLCLANVLKLAKLCWPMVNGQLFRGKLERVCAIEQKPISGSVVAAVRACGGGGSSFIGPLKKWIGGGMSLPWEGGWTRRSLKSPFQPIPFYTVPQTTYQQAKMTPQTVKAENLEFQT